MFNLMSRTNETRSIKWHEACNCICRLMKLFVTTNKDGIKINVDMNVKNYIDKEVCDKGFIWNPSNCECECGKSCNISQYLDYSNCKCKKKLIDPLIE